MEGLICIADFIYQVAPIGHKTFRFGHDWQSSGFTELRKTERQTVFSEHAEQGSFLIVATTRPLTNTIYG